MSDEKTEQENRDEPEVEGHFKLKRNDESGATEDAADDEPDVEGHMRIKKVENH